jgi:hypothetical protein
MNTSVKLNVSFKSRRFLDQLVDYINFLRKPLHHGLVTKRDRKVYSKGVYIFNKYVLCCVTDLAGRNCHLLHIHIYCCRINHTTHSQIIFLFSC